MVAKPSFQSLIDFHQTFHLILIPRKYHQYIRVRICHDRQQALYDVVSKILPILLRVTQSVCLIYKKNISLGLFQQFGHSFFCMPDISPDQLPALHLYHFTFRQETERLEYFSDQPGHSGLAGSRITRKQHVMKHVKRTVHTQLLAGRLKTGHHQHVVQLSLQRRKSDQSMKFTHTGFVFLQTARNVPGLFVRSVIRKTDILRL